MFGFIRKKDKAQDQQNGSEGVIADLQAQMEKLEDKRDAIGTDINTLNAARKTLMAKLQAATAASDKNELARRILLVDKQIKSKDDLRRTFDEKISGIIDKLTALGVINATEMGGTDDIISPEDILKKINDATERAQTDAVKGDLIRDGVGQLSASGRSQEMDDGIAGILAEAEGTAQSMDAGIAGILAEAERTAQTVQPAAPTKAEDEPERPSGTQPAVQI